MVIGGTGSLLGPIVGAFVYYRVDEFTRELPDEDVAARLRAATSSRAGRTWRRSSSPALLILLMFVAPFGIVGVAKRIGRRIVQVVPAAAGRRRRRSRAEMPARERSRSDHDHQLAIDTALT